MFCVAPVAVAVAVALLLAGGFLRYLLCLDVVVIHYGVCLARATVALPCRFNREKVRIPPHVGCDHACSRPQVGRIKIESFGRERRLTTKQNLSSVLRFYLCVVGSYFFRFLRQFHFCFFIVL